MATNPLSIPPHPDKTIPYFTGVGTRNELVQSYRDFNPEFPIEPVYHYLHHLMENSEFFREMLEAFTEEIQEIVETLVHLKAISYASHYFPGDMDHFDNQMRNIGQLLNHDPDYYLVPYMFDYRRQEIEWKKFDTESTHFMHKYRNSYIAYKFLFSRIWRHGGIYLEIYYPEGQGTGVLNEVTDKAVRLVDNSTVMFDWLPPVGNWPTPGYITGLESYNQFERLYAFRFDDRARPEWDTGTEYGGDASEIVEDESLDHPDLYADENLIKFNVDVDPVYFFDTVNFPWVRDRTVILSMTADRILNLQENSLRTDPPDCLMDIPFLQYVRQQSMRHRKVTERVKVGTQITLACDNSGEFVKSGESAHTIPDMRADVVVLPNNFEENAEPARIRLGTGIVTGALRSRLFRRPGDFQKQAVYGESSVYDWSTYQGPETQIGDPEDLEEIEQIEEDEEAVSVDDFRMVEPVFSTVIGEFERIDVTANMLAINTMIEMRRLDGGSEPALLTSPEQEDPEERESTVVAFPHEFIAPGSFGSTMRLDTFYIRVAAEMVDQDEGTLSLTQKNIPMKAFLFNLAAVSEEFDIVPRLLYDFETLSFFGGPGKEEAPADPNDGWAELHAALNDGYRWPFMYLEPPNASMSFGEFILSLDPATDDMHAEALEYLRDGDTDKDLGDTSHYEYVQEWLETSQWFEFYPVDDYDANGKAVPLDSDVGSADFLENAKINWRGAGWRGASWYPYIPQYLWQVYVQISEGVNPATGLWEPDVEYYIFNELTFREALRFFEMDVTETTTSNDFTTQELLGFLDDFFVSIGREGLYARTQFNDEDPWKDYLQEDHRGFFDPTFTGGIADIPLIVLHNHTRIDKEFEYEVPPIDDPDGPPQTLQGVRLDLREGQLEFRIDVADHLDLFVPPTLDPEQVSDNTIDERLPREDTLREVRLSYTINTTADFEDVDDVSSRIVGITEAGIFNTEDKLIAYANFPPVIYDSFNNHLAVNWYISTLHFVAP